MKNIWKHVSKYKGKTFTGDYELQKNGETWFYLNDSKGKTVFKFRSHQAAKKAGFQKLSVQ